MPKTSHKKKNTLLIDNKKLLAAKNAINVEELEDCLTALINQANKIYTQIYHNAQREHQKNFLFCIQNSRKIRNIITAQRQKNLKSPLIDAFYLEAWLSSLQADLNALDLNPPDIKQLNKNNKKIKETNDQFKELDLKFNGLKENNADFKSTDFKTTLNTLSKYVTNFSQSWETNKNRLTAVYHYNFAETLVEKSNLEEAMGYFTESHQFYTRATEKSDDLCKNELLLQSAERAIARIKEIKAIKENKNSTPSNHTKRKRELSEEPTYRETKKIKKDFLNGFTQISINDNLDGILKPFHNKSFDERYAIVHNNYAVTIMADLNNISNSEKLKLLNKATELFRKSAEFYKQAKLTTKKDSIDQCLKLFTSTIMKLEVLVSKKPDPIASNRKQTCNKQIINTTQPTRYTRTFFRNLSCPENNATKVDTKPILDDGLGYSP